MKGQILQLKRSRSAPFGFIRIKFGFVIKYSQLCNEEECNFMNYKKFY